MVEETEEVRLHEYRVHFLHEKEEGTFEGYSFETAQDSSEATEMFLDWIRENEENVENYKILDSERTVG